MGVVAEFFFRKKRWKVFYTFEVN